MNKYNKILINLILAVLASGVTHAARTARTAGSKAATIPAKAATFPEVTLSDVGLSVDRPLSDDDYLRIKYAVFDRTFDIETLVQERKEALEQETPGKAITLHEALLHLINYSKDSKTNVWIPNTEARQHFFKNRVYAAKAEAIRFALDIPMEGLEIRSSILSALFNCLYGQDNRSLHPDCIDFMRRQIVGVSEGSDLTYKQIISCLIAVTPGASDRFPEFKTRVQEVQNQIKNTKRGSTLAAVFG